MNGLPQGLRKRIERQVPGSLEPVRPLASGRRLAAAFLALLAGALALVAVSLLALPWGESRNFVSAGFHCLAFGLAFTAPVVVLLAVVMRRRLSLSPVTTGATAGLLAGRWWTFKRRTSARTERRGRPVEHRERPCCSPWCW
jgi:hypothetical protein